MAAWACFRQENIALLSGKLRRVSHAERLRSFADCFGTPIFFQDDEASESIDVTICSMDQLELCSPDVAIWADDRLPWVAHTVTLPQYHQARENP
jgi:hypothetical protein